MSIVKVIEVIASSELGFEDAVKNAVAEVSQTIKNIDSVYVKDFKVHVEEGQVKSYGVICKISFRVEKRQVSETFSDEPLLGAEAANYSEPDFARREIVGEERVDDIDLDKAR